MNLRTLSASVVLLGACSIVSPSPVRAECITPGPWLIEQGLVDLVFSGNVVGVNQVAEAGIRVTFNVDRVWKGSVPKRFDLYVWLPDAEMPTFSFAGRYVVFATKMTGRSLEGVGLTSDVPAFKPGQCGALDYSAAEKSGTIRGLGIGRHPN